MPSLRRDLRSQLETSVLKARELAEQGAREALATLGVDQAKPFEHLKPDQKTLRNQLRARGRQAGDALADSGRQEIGHLAGITAYEHWHRMLFARFLAENSLLLEPEHQVPVSLADVEELAREAKTDVWDLAGRFAQRMLPAVFRADDPVLALPLARETRVQLERLVADLPREVFLADDSLGWTYQFWQAKRKEEVNKSGVKIGADELSPVTQLFTEDYMVEFLLHNTLGAWWAGKLGPVAAATEEEARAMAALSAREGVAVAWRYLRFVQDAKSKTWSPAAGSFAGWPRLAREIRFLDPCMGSGHFVVFALPLLARLRMEEERLGDAEAVSAVLRDNLHGLELDERCTQIAAFNLALAAWKLGGHQALPPLHLACSGLAPNAPEKDWVALAGDNEKLQRGMERLYRLFQKAAVLGSLINPRAGEGDLLEAAFHELQPLLEKALAQEAKDDTSHEMAVTARGIAKAAEILAGQFTLVATNVPYLGRPKQDEILTAYCERVHPEAKADLATCFLERCSTFCTTGGTASLVTPQNWLFLAGYKKLRERLLAERKWDLLARLGPRAFETIGGEVVNVVLIAITKQKPTKGDVMAGVEASLAADPKEKAAILRGEMTKAVLVVSQLEQLENPDARVNFDPGPESELLSKRAYCFQGSSMMDMERLRLRFWEMQHCGDKWDLHLSSPTGNSDYTGCNFVSATHDRRDINELAELLKSEGRLGGWKSGRQLIGKKGVTVAWLGELPTGLYPGKPFDHSAAVIVPFDETHLAALWCYCADPVFQEQVRKIDQKAQVANTSFVKVPFDLAHWQKVAAEKYPHGLPKPFSSDPTQWLFNGHPAGADQPLHVAVARLLGYDWPRQTGSSFSDCPALPTDGLAEFADDDGIVCLTPLRGERSGADRLRTLLSAALGDHDEQALIRATESKAKSLEAWLRDECFAQHNALFHNRPFIWHLWDGRSDGFHALVNYHKLAAADGAGRKLLETLTYSYLGDWIRAQQDGLKRNEAGSEDRLIGAQALQKELEAILRGEPPYDLFVRWKPLHQQPIGWEPDINDGVRMNIRPFLLANDVGRKGAGILRAKPNIKWDKDRGTEPERPKADFPWFWTWDQTSEDFTGGSAFDGCRWNDCHYTLAAKRAARAKAK